MKTDTRSQIHYDSTRGQAMTLLLAALESIRVSASKREVIQHVSSHKFFEIQDEDRVPYPSAQTHEPRWHCLIAWARKDCVQRGWLFNDERDAWGITRDGIDIYQRTLGKFRNGNWKANRCYLWTPTFKRMMQPDYISSSKDLRRPFNIYRDIQGFQLNRFLADFDF